MKSKLFLGALILSQLMMATSSLAGDICIDPNKPVDQMNRDELKVHACWVRQNGYGFDGLSALFAGGKLVFNVANYANQGSWAAVHRNVEHFKGFNRMFTAGILIPAGVGLEEHYRGINIAKQAVSMSADKLPEAVGPVGSTVTGKDKSGRTDGQQ